MLAAVLLLEKVEDAKGKAKPLPYVPNAAFRIISGEKGETYPVGGNGDVFHTNLELNS